MPERELPARPNLQHYKKQAKNLVKSCRLGIPEAITRLSQHHPRFHKTRESDMRTLEIASTDAQLVIAREHGFDSWPKFRKHIDMVNRIRSFASLRDPVTAFIEVACVPRHTDHRSGTLEDAEMILSRHPQVATSNLYIAAILGDETSVIRFLAHDSRNATAAGGPRGWDALTHLCFSRYLRLDKARSEAFVRAAKGLLDAGANANTGWYETIDYPSARRLWESALYGAAGIARHPELTELLLEHGADPNDEETPYHVPEGYDNTVMKILLESGKLNDASLAWMLLRKIDWHDREGIQLLLARGADPNVIMRFGDNALHHALRRDNGLRIVELLLDHGADVKLKDGRDGRSAVAMAARRGRGDVLTLFEQRGAALDLEGADQLIAACARADGYALERLIIREPHLRLELIAESGRLVAEFAGNGNVGGLQCLFNLGVSASEVYKEGDPYFDIAKGSLALHVAAWRGRPFVLKELIQHGAPVNALDGRGRTALALAVKACIDSYWMAHRSPDSVEALLRAGASVSGIEIPTGYDEIDQLLRECAAKQSDIST